MQKLTLATLLLLATVSWATDPKPVDYTITVHVSATHIAFFSGHLVQDLDVIIGGKKYELISELTVGQLLALGDYKARLVKDEHRTIYDSYQLYEFLFPDGKTRKYDVVGEIE
jgi:hypothetical protein